MMNNEFTPIAGYENYYEINIDGIVKSVSRTIKLKKGSRKINSKILSTRLNNCGYEEVRLSMDNITTTKFVHRLLAEAFIPNPDQKKEINHKDGNTQNNSIGNLEWVTHSENMLHAYKFGLIKNKAKPVIDICTGQKFSSTKEASLCLGINQSTLKSYLNGAIKNNSTCLQYAA